MRLAAVRTNRLGSGALWGGFLLLGVTCGGEEGDGLPPILASSKYIDYSTYADASVICMDDFLAREDRFIERTAAALGVEVPTGRIRYISGPLQALGDPSTWACETTTACYWYEMDQDFGVILSMGISHHHELVHAVEVPALGADGHRILAEGLADYLGSSKTSAPVLEAFPERFKAMAAESAKPGDYRLAMHFVGSLISRHGAGKYRALRAAMPGDGGLTALAAAFRKVYGEALDDALVDMSAEPIVGLDRPEGCVDGEGEEIAWKAPGLLEATLMGECGDGMFVGGGFVDGHPGFATVFVVHVLEAGVYELTVSRPGAVSEQPAATLGACPDAEFGGIVSSKDGLTGTGLLYPGRYVLSVGFPQAPEARGEATVKLKLRSPLPPPSPSPVVVMQDWQNSQGMER